MRRVSTIFGLALHGFSRKSYTSSGLSFALRPAKQRLKKVEWSERRVDQGNEVLARVRTTRLAGSQSLLDEPLSRKIELP